MFTNGTSINNFLRSLDKHRIKDVIKASVINTRYLAFINIKLPFLSQINHDIHDSGLRYKNLGKSGLRVSNVGLGTWSVFSNGISEEQAETIIRLAYESGINLFDLSDLHSGPRAEIEMGKILKKANWKRMTYVVTVKIYWSIK